MKYSQTRLRGWQFSWQAEEKPELGEINRGEKTPPKTKKKKKQPNSKNPSTDDSNSFTDSVLRIFSPKTVVSPLQSKNWRKAHKKEVAMSKGFSKSTESWHSCVVALFFSQECSRSTQLLV